MLGRSNHPRHLIATKIWRMTINRREFMKFTGLVGGGVAFAGARDAIAADAEHKALPRTSITVVVNEQARGMTVEPRMTLLDALREELHLTGTKKACDRGECGACTVHVEGRRVLSCMTLAVMQDGKRITTIEGLERDGTLHPLQAAFIEHDGFQCGFCTSGQIMSAVAMIEEAKARLAERRDARCDEAVHALRSVERGDPRTDERQSVPLRLLSQHCGRDRRSSRRGSERCTPLRFREPMMLARLSRRMAATSRFHRRRH